MSRAEEIRSALLRAHAENRLHHAYILSGAESETKAECVERFAADLFAAAGGGGLFGAADPGAFLSRIQRGMHPDFLRFTPVNGVIGVDEVRELPKALSYAPLESPIRIVLVTEAEALNAQASNAVLKILEEPPPHTMFFLLARDTESLLETITSRCQTLRFFPLSDEEIEKSVPGAPLSWCEGSLGRARKFAESEGAAELRKNACEHLLALWENSPRIPSGAVNWVEALDGDDERGIAIESWELLTRDLAYALAGADSSLRFPEYRVRLQALAKGADAEALAEAGTRFSAINRFRVQENFHANAKLALVNLLCELQIFSVGKSRQDR